MLVFRNRPRIVFVPVTAVPLLVFGMKHHPYCCIKMNYELYCITVPNATSCRSAAQKSLWEFLSHQPVSAYISTEQMDTQHGMGSHTVWRARICNGKTSQADQEKFRWFFWFESLSKRYHILRVFRPCYVPQLQVKSRFAMKKY